MVSHRPHCHCCCCCCNHLFLPQALPYVILLIAMLFFIYAIIGMQVGKPRKPWERNKLRILSWNCSCFRKTFFLGFREHYPEPRHRLQPPRPLPNLSPGPSGLIQVNILIPFLFLSYSGEYSYNIFILVLIRQNIFFHIHLLRIFAQIRQDCFTLTSEKRVHFHFLISVLSNKPWVDLITKRQNLWCFLPESIYEWQQDLNCTAESLKPWRISNHRPRKMWAPEEKNSNILEEGILIFIDKHKRARPRTHS